MTDDLDETIAKRVRAALRETHMTNDEVAAAAGLSRRSLQRRLAGERSFLVIEIHCIARYIGPHARLLSRVFGGR